MRRRDAALTDDACIGVVIVLHGNEHVEGLLVVGLPFFGRTLPLLTQFSKRTERLHTEVERAGQLLVNDGLPPDPARRNVVETPRY